MQRICPGKFILIVIRNHRHTISNAAPLLFSVDPYIHTFWLGLLPALSRYSPNWIFRSLEKCDLISYGVLFGQPEFSLSLHCRLGSSWGTLIWGKTNSSALALIEWDEIRSSHICFHFYNCTSLFINVISHFKRHTYDKRRVSNWASTCTWIST